MENAGPITVFMRSQNHPQSAGWMVRLKAHDSSFRATRRPERFGRVSHIIKKDGAFLRLQQGVSSESKTVFADLSEAQHMILSALVEIGIVGRNTR